MRPDVSAGRMGERHREEKGVSDDGAKFSCFALKSPTGMVCGTCRAELAELGGRRWECRNTSCRDRGIHREMSGPVAGVVAMTKEGK